MIKQGVKSFAKKITSVIHVTEGQRSYVMEENNLHWFALYTKPRWEKKVAGILEEKGIENYCPLNKVVKKWSDRKKIVLEPIFKSYVFVRVPEAEKWELKSINGIINFVYWLGKPARVKDEDIFTIKKFLNEFSNVTVEEAPRLQVSSKVRIKQGVLMNYQGILIELSGNNAKVRIESMGLQLSAQFDKKEFGTNLKGSVSAASAEFDGISFGRFLRKNKKAANLKAFLSPKPYTLHLS